MSSHERILERERSALLVIDLQEAYRGKLLHEQRVVATAGRLLAGAGTLGVPVVLTEQYPKGLGHTRAELEAHVPGGCRRFEKTSFSALGAPGLREHLQELGREQIVVVGIETHVCVNQTVHALLGDGYRVHAVRDAISARFPLEDDAGWAKILGAGAVPGCGESVLFEWLRDARAPEFKAVQRLVV